MTTDTPSPDARPGPDEDVVVEKTFEIDRSPEEAWSLLEGLRSEHGVGTGTWWLPGFRCRATEIAATRAERLVVTKDEPPCADTVIVFTFEHLASGARIRVTQSGFDPTFVAEAGEHFWTHGAALLDDVERFFA